MSTRRIAVVISTAAAVMFAAACSASLTDSEPEGAVSLVVYDKEFAGSDTIRASLNNDTAVDYEAPGCTLDLQREISSHVWERVNQLSLAKCNASDADGHVVIESGEKLFFAIPVESWMETGTYRLSWLASKRPVLLLSKQTFTISQ